jgi:hypothetical protein
MADGSGKVMEMVREELQRNPGATTQELLDKAKKLDKTLGTMTVRQFHARFPLQIKRRLAGMRSRGRRRARGSTVDRGAVRTVLLQFARDIAGADGKAQVVDIIGGVETYVDRLVKATGRS